MKTTTINNPKSVKNDITLADKVLVKKSGLKYHIPGLGWVFVKNK